jgi:hypothetical protein
VLKNTREAFASLKLFIQIPNEKPKVQINLAQPPQQFFLDVGCPSSTALGHFAQAASGGPATVP